MELLFPEHQEPLEMKEDKLKGKFLCHGKRSTQSSSLFRFTVTKGIMLPRKQTLPDPTMDGLCMKSRVKKIPHYTSSSPLILY